MSKQSTNGGKDIALKISSGDFTLVASRHWFEQLLCE